MLGAICERATPERQVPAPAWSTPALDDIRHASSPHHIPLSNSDHADLLDLVWRRESAITTVGIDELLSELLSDESVGVIRRRKVVGQVSATIAPVERAAAGAIDVIAPHVRRTVAPLRRIQ